MKWIVEKPVKTLCLLALSFAFSIVLLTNSAAAGQDHRPPNIVIVFMDDMGYADIGPFGGNAQLTPNLNRLAEEGRRFTSFYVSQAVCSASRASLLTGCYNNRIGILGALGPNSKIGLHADEVTLGELCQQKQYATACFGKWHLGHHPQFLPMQNGFDEYFGLPYSNDMWPFHPEVRHLPLEERLKRWPHLPLIDGNKVIVDQVTDSEQTQLTTQYTERAVSFIDRNAAKPFLLYVAHSMVHVPLYVSDKFSGKSETGLFGDVVMEIDWSVGQIMDALKRNGLDENTLVVFTSDNGPWLSYGNHAGSAGPFREGKGTMFEGGCRVPCIMRWPGRIPANTVCSEPAMTIDLFPTVAHLIEATLPAHTLDGRNIWPLMAGEDGATSPQEAYYLYYGSKLHAVRSGPWKLHLPHEYRTLDGQPAGLDGIPANYRNATLPLSLFNLESDPGETNNVADQNPDTVAHLLMLAEKARADLGDDNQKGRGLRPAGTVLGKIED